MKNRYIFIILTFILLYIIFLILEHKYYEYKINYHIESIEELISDISKYNKTKLETIQYKASQAQINKFWKEQQGFKNKNEVVVYLTKEQTYNKFTKENIEEKEIKENKSINNYIDNKTILEKWIYFLFKKEI